jgi:hypothetical protein
MEITLDLKYGVDSVSIDPNQPDDGVELSLHTMVGENINILLKEETLADLISKLNFVYDYYLKGDEEE